ncbi:MAG: hypothetical protein LBM08_00770 [Dysgonamonadaceae bacterium]|jgi:hypothetical protein|nr:hypothetical protein [Dysgonamonadaceae bacterium]
MRFNEFKNEILRRAKEANACTDEYRRACQSKNFRELMRVIKDNFTFAVSYEVIDASLIAANKYRFNTNQIYCNVNVNHGFLLVCGNATVEVRGNGTVRAYNNTVVGACDNGTVRAYDRANVKMWGNATVEARDNATVEVRNNGTVRAYNNAIVKAWYSTTVEAWDNAYVTSYYNIGCKLNDNAIYRIRESDTVKYASDNIRFEKVSRSETEEKDNITIIKEI